jgi:hypothetical protein
MILRALALLFLAAAQVAPADSWTGIDRVVAIGDVHGDYDQLVSLLGVARLIDAQGKWIGEKTHLVQTGDLLDRGPDSRKAMDLLMRLEDEARAAGGAVHCLIGNHEAMNITGDLRYVSEGEYAAFRDGNSEKVRAAFYLRHQEELKAALPAERLPKFDDAYRKAFESQVPLGFAEHRAAFGPDGKYGRWIRGHNAVVRIDGSLFLHGGISPKYAEWELRRINEQIRQELRDPSRIATGIVQDDEGPLWYRGLARGDEAAMEGPLQAVLKNYKVDRIVIGHTFTDGTILPRFDGRVLMIDVGLARLYDPALRSACLVIEKGKPHTLHRGRPLRLPSDSGPDYLRYLKEAAALEPSPSPLAEKVRELDARLKK